MSAVDLWAIVALAVACVALLLRGYMLSSDFSRWVSAPRPVSLALLGFGLVQGMGLVSIGNGSHATAREALIYTTNAIVAVIMLVNLARQKPQVNLIREILDHVNTDLLTAPREAIGRAIEAVRDAARRAGVHG